MHEAGIWNYHPKSERFGAFSAFAFSNPWGHVFDRWGQNFIGDASPGFSYWAAPISGHIDYPNKHPGGSQHRRVAKTIRMAIRSIRFRLSTKNELDRSAAVR